MKQLIIALVIVLFSFGYALGEEGARLVVLVGVETVPPTKAQIYNPEGNTDPIKIKMIVTDQGVDFIWELLPQANEEPPITTAIEPIITGD